MARAWCCALAALTALALGTAGVRAETIYAVTGLNTLVSFDSATPGTLATSVTVTGLSGERIVGLDFRPATGQLYGLGNSNRLFTINPNTGTATPVGPAALAPLGVTSVGMDFNPTVDRIRVVTSSDLNLRLNPGSGALVATDTTLAYAAGDANAAANPSVSAVAYLNNTNGATTTTLYGIDTVLNILVTINPPNNGTLNTVGALGVAASTLNGFDISGVTGTAYAGLSVGGVAQLYTIDRATGAATLVGNIGPGTATVRGLTVAPAPVGGELLYGVTDAGALVLFNSLAPGILLRSATITGLAAGESLLGIDFRPATGQLFGLGSSNTLYTLNTNTGAATLVAGLSVALNGTAFGMDFNPTVDRIRVVSDADQNLRINPASGVATVDSALNPGNPTLTAVAYANNTNGATSTTLFGLDYATDQLLIVNPPNNGTLVAVGSLGVDATAVNGFDISGRSGLAYAALDVSAGTSRLFLINLTTGAATLVGNIGAAGTIIRALAVTPPPVTGEPIYGVTDAGALVLFNSAAPTIIQRSVTITGLAGGESLLGIDFRPANGLLYGLGSANNLYTLNTNTGVATLVGTSSATLSNAAYGFDFNPTVDRIRVINDADQNFRFNPNNGALAAVDTALAYAAGDTNFGANPGVNAVAYANNTNGATTTTLYALDTTLDTLVTINPPNNGALNTVGPLGVDVTAVNGFDISGNSGVAYAALAVGTAGSRLYTINLATGAATAGGFIASATGLPLIRALAVPTAFPGGDPAIKCLTGLTVECTGGLTPVSFTVTATNAAGPAAVVCVPPSGTGFRIGTSNVVCTIPGTTISCTFPVIVQDTQPPGLVCSSNLEMRATSAAGAVVTYFASAFDPCGIATFDCTPSAGSTFPIGVTIVTCTASDPALNTNSCSFTVTVLANNCPVAANLNVSVASGASASFQLPGSDLDLDPLQYQITQAPQHGLLVVQVQTGAASYTPTPGYCGPDSFKYTVRDSQCGSAPGTVSISIDCTLRQKKQVVLAELIALHAAATDHGDQNHLDDAIDHVRDSLADALWLDGNHLVAKKGKKVFDEEEDAVDELRDILKDIKDHDSAQSAAVIQDLINRLVAIDRALAVISVDEAEADGANPHKIAEDREEIQDGDKDAAKGKCDEAIKHYRDAWAHAVKLKTGGHMIVQHSVAGFRLRFAGLAGEQYVLQVSTDFVHWTNLASITADSSGNVDYTDTGAAGQAARFYRVAQP